MAIAIAIASILGLIALCVRTWTEFGQRAQTLKAEIEHRNRLIEDHTAKLDLVRSKVNRIKEETEPLLEKGGTLEADVLGQRTNLTELEKKLERHHPASHQIDMTAEDGPE